MCLLSFFPEGVMPNADELNNGAIRNSDGSGYAILTPDKVLIGKDLTNPVRIIEEFCELRAKHPGMPALFHSRFGTSGKMSTENVHPFFVGQLRDTVLAHNGVFPELSNKRSPRSDTRIFAEDIAGTRYRDIDKPKIHAKLMGFLGRFNKVVILTINPRFKHNAYVLNEGEGNWTDAGIWHSNWDYVRTITIRPLTPPKPLFSAGHIRQDFQWKNCRFCQGIVCVAPHFNVCLWCRSCNACGEFHTECECGFSVSVAGMSDDDILSYEFARRNGITGGE